MRPSEQQQRQVDALSSLLTKPDRPSIIQGVELATALDDPLVFEALISGVEIEPLPKVLAPARRYPSVKPGPLFQGAKTVQPWLDLAMVHLIAASEHPFRSKITSLALGSPRYRGSNRLQQLWLEGLERLTALTHLDLLVTDLAVDLAPLASFPRLTHLRIRGRTGSLDLPALEHLEVFNGVEVEFAPGTVFPNLHSFRGRVHGDDPISPELMPNLVDVEILGPLRVKGFESLGKVWCSRGQVELLDCTRVEHLRVSGRSFDAPDLRHIEILDQVGSLNMSQFDTVGGVRMNRTTRFVGGRFPAGTKLLDPKVVLWGPTLTDLSNIGELEGLEVLTMLRTKNPVSLDTLRHATSLRVLDIRNSPGITDLTPLVGLPSLETIVMGSRDSVAVPPELEHLINRARTRPKKAPVRKSRPAE